MNTHRTNQLTKWLASLAALAAVSANHLLHAQPWQTVLDYQYPPNGTASGGAIAADTSGNVFTAGNGSDATGVTRGLVLKADTTYAAWNFSDDTNPSPSQYKSFIWDFGLDSNGSLYSIGQLTPNSTGLPYWYVRKSSDTGLTWATVDLYQYAAGQWINAAGFTADDAGNIYVVGWARDVSKKHYLHWLVRKSADGGRTWSLVDDVQGPTSNFGAAGAGFVPGAGVFVVGAPYAGSTSSWLVRRSLSGEPGSWSTVDDPFVGAAQAVGNDSAGNIYVVGAKYMTTTTKGKATSYSSWVTRKSINGGNTWSTVDEFSYASSKDALAFGIGRNALGNVVVVGRGLDAQGKMHWLVRMQDAFGAWQIVDEFQLAPGYSASALGVTTDTAGNLLVSGFAYDATGSHWIVRRLTAVP